MAIFYRVVINSNNNTVLYKKAALLGIGENKLKMKT